MLTYPTQRQRATALLPFLALVATLRTSCHLWLDLRNDFKREDSNNDANGDVNLCSMLISFMEEIDVIVGCTLSDSKRHYLLTDLSSSGTHAAIPHHLCADVPEVQRANNTSIVVVLGVGDSSCSDFVDTLSSPLALSGKDVKEDRYEDEGISVSLCMCVDRLMEDIGMFVGTSLHDSQVNCHYQLTNPGGAYTVTHLS